MPLVSRNWALSLLAASACATGAPPGDEGFTFGNQDDGGTSGATVTSGVTVTPTTTIDPSATSVDPSAGATGDSGGSGGPDTGQPPPPTTGPAVDTGCVPAEEICNGVDDDCNNEIDETDPDLGAPCDTGMSGICGDGTQICDGANGLMCMPDMRSAPEMCNGLDDDCDGTADNGNPEGGAACSTGMPGICSAGTQTCTMGNLACVADQMPAGIDTCGNGLDDDCNGVVDDGCLGCYDVDLGNGVPQSVNGSTVGQSNDMPASCGAGGGADFVYLFEAPAAATYTFDLIGSSYDTVLALFSDCLGTELACNDDFAGNPLCGGFACSEISIGLAAGQQILISVEGYSGATGAFTLNIN